MAFSVSRKWMVSALCLALVVGFLAPAEAAKKKKKKPPAPVSAEQQMFLRGDACDAEARALSLTDGADAECIYTRAGLLYDAIPESAPAPVGSNPNHTWPAIDGVPLTLDATTPITGEIYTSGLFPLVGDYPGISGGSVRLTVTLVGESGGEEKTIGEFVDEFTAVPGSAPHASMVEIAPEADLDGAEFTSLTLITRIGGASMGHGVYKLDNPSSFITVPTWVAPS